MKKVTLALAFFFASFLHMQLLAQQVEVLDFHNTHRCKTCVKIENTTLEIIQQEFAKELREGKIVFRTIDVDEAKNAKIAEQFEAAGTALWIYRADKKIKVDLTDFAFMNIGNSDKFKQRLIAEIRKAL